MSELLTDAEVSVLNAARMVLAGIEKRALDFSGTSDQKPHEHLARGRLAEACDRAGGGIFNALNVAQSFCHVDLTHEQLHMRPDPLVTT
jgi:hypothetical protein